MFTPQQLTELLYKAVLGFAGISLSVNAYMIKDKVADMTEAMKLLNERMATISVEHAVMTKEVERHAERLDTHHQRIQFVESRSERHDVLLEQLTHSKGG